MVGPRGGGVDNDGLAARPVPSPHGGHYAAESAALSPAGAAGESPAVVGSAGSCVFVGTEYRVAGRPRGAAGAGSPVLLSSAAVQPLALAATKVVRAASAVFSVCCRACACGVGGFLGVLSGLCCDGDGFAVCVECVAEFCYQGDAGGEEVLRSGAFVGLRCGHDGETPGPLVLAGAPSLNGRRAHARTTDCSCPQRGGVGAAATTKAHPTAWRAAGWSSLAGITGGRGRLGVRVCSGVCAPASRAIWYGCGPTTRSKMYKPLTDLGFGLALRWPVGHTGCERCARLKEGNPMPPGDTADEDAAIAEAMAADDPGPVAAVRRAFGGRRRRREPGGRPHLVGVRFTDEEFETVLLRAAAARVGVSHYVALRALEAPVVGAVGMDLLTMRRWAEELHGLRRQVQRVGVNVNQVARLLNGGGGVGQQAEETLAATQAALAELDPLVEWMASTSGAQLRRGDGTQ